MRQTDEAASAALILLYAADRGSHLSVPGHVPALAVWLAQPSGGLASFNRHRSSLPLHAV
jgi:hypothetical protein